MTHQRVEITRDIPDDKETALIVNSFTEKQEAMLAEEAGPVSTDLDGRFQVLHPAQISACASMLLSIQLENVYIFPLGEGTCRDELHTFLFLLGVHAVALYACH